MQPQLLLTQHFSHVRKLDRCSAVGVAQPAFLKDKSDLHGADVYFIAITGKYFTMLTEDRFALANGTTARQQALDVDAFSNTQGIFQLNAQITHCAIDLRVTE